ncbi:MAG: trigger factor family protein, partial [Oscillospiraceae bacterium]|nr:trigger factor family protein [Oscillospiraceae bacterium]
MKVKSFEKPENKAAELTVEISPEEFDKAVNQAFAKNKDKISVPGFRKGHAPRKMLENMYGDNLFYDDAIEILYPKAFDFAYDQEKIDIVGHPSIKDVKYPEAGGAEIVFLFWLQPTIKVEGYKGLSAPKPAVRVTKKDVDEEIDRIAERNSREQQVDRE